MSIIRDFKWLALSLLALVLAYQSWHFISEKKELINAARKASAAVSHFEKELDQLSSDSVLYLFKGHASKHLHHAQWFQLPYILLAYQDDSLVFWSSNTQVPVQPPSAFQVGLSIQKFRNGYFLVYRKAIDGHVGKQILLLQPVRLEYATYNSFLRPHFDPAFGLPEYFNVSTENAESFLAVKSEEGKEIFWLGVDSSLRNSRIIPGAILFFMLALIFFLVQLNHWVRILFRKGKFYAVLLVLLSSTVAIVLIVSQKQWLPASVGNWQLFDADLFANSGIATSLGALIIQLIFLFWFCINLVLHVPLIPRANNKGIRYASAIVSYSFIFFFTCLCIALFRSLIVDSNIRYEFLNPVEPDYFSICGVFCMTLSICCLFLLAQRILQYVKHQQFFFREQFLLQMVVSILAFLFACIWQPIAQVSWMIVWVNLFLFLIPWFQFQSLYQLGFVKFFLLLCFFSASGATLLFVFTMEKEKNSRVQFASKLVDDRDPLIEFRLGELQTVVSSDPYLVNYFNSPISSQRELKSRLLQLYFSEGFSRYEVEFYPFDSSGRFILMGEETRTVTERWLKADKREVNRESLYYSFHPDGSVSYLALYPVLNSDRVIGKLYVEISANVFTGVSVYPTLLLDENDKFSLRVSEYAYAVYNNAQLVSRYGPFIYGFEFDFDYDEQSELQFQNLRGSNHLIYNPGNEMLVVVSQKNNQWSAYLSFFSYLFVILFLFVACLAAGSRLHFIRSKKIWTAQLASASMQTLIQLFFMIFTFLLVLSVGYVSGKFFLNQFNEMTREHIEEKLAEVRKGMNLASDFSKQSVHSLTDFHAALRANVSRLSQIQEIDINFYDLQGSLIASSQPSIFEKGLESRKINPAPYEYLKYDNRTIHVETEQIGTQEYFSGYETIRNLNGDPLAIMQLPYYNSREDLNRQVGFFFSALVNILVLAIILAGLIAPVISRQITRRLLLISNRFSQLQIGKQPEPIQWPAKDEIGGLVNEYNKMIFQLQESAEKLKQTERDMAWREMAKQIAHEIKNPLTPMRLSVQHLQRAIARKAPDVNELTQKVTETLLEQIDNLNNIASQFSSFATMPRPDAEWLDLNEIVKSSLKLYDHDENVKFDYLAYNVPLMVFADKNLLMQVFNNLLLNAVQSIPENRGGRIEIKNFRENQIAIVAIKDDGVGIPESEKHKVFVPSFTTKSSGTGLGLAISKTIVEGFDGSIWFESNPSTGTTFFVKLPIQNRNELS